jgi:hypothetical protein
MAIHRRMTEASRAVKILQRLTLSFEEPAKYGYSEKRRSKAFISGCILAERVTSLISTFISTFPASKTNN